MTKQIFKEFGKGDDLTLCFQVLDLRLQFFENSCPVVPSKQHQKLCSQRSHRTPRQPGRNTPIVGSARADAPVKANPGCTRLELNPLTSG